VLDMRSIQGTKFLSQKSHEVLRTSLRKKPNIGISFMQKQFAKYIESNTILFDSLFWQKNQSQANK
jgi:hypothetical protein